MKIIVGTAITNRAFTRFGVFDNRMNYVLGLQELGHEVYFVGEVDSKRCYSEEYQPVGFANWEGRNRFEQLARTYGIWPRCSLIYNGGEATHGLPFDQMCRLAKEAAVLININGRLTTPEIVESVGCRAYVDLDPGKTQVYHAEYGIDQGIDRHEVFFTVGFNIGDRECQIPTCGKTWHALAHPVTLSQWPVGNGDGRRFTSISSWSGKETFDFKGQFSGEKSDQWQEYLSLPLKTEQNFELTLKIHPEYASDIRAFQANGWVLSDPQQFRTPHDYRSYISKSCAEFSIANRRYVAFQTGWFSDRTARYLACGKPVLIQSTGIERVLPTGKGILTFSSMDEAVEGVGMINDDYAGHCRAARKLAEEYFDSRRSLGSMLKTIGCS